MKSAGYKIMPLQTFLSTNLASDKFDEPNDIFEKLGIKMDKLNMVQRVPPIESAEARKSSGKSMALGVFGTRNCELDCSLHYTDDILSKKQNECVFAEARETIVSRLCRGKPCAPPLPVCEHPVRSHQGGNKFLRCRARAQLGDLQFKKFALNQFRNRTTYRLQKNMAKNYSFSKPNCNKRLLMLDDNLITCSDAVKTLLNVDTQLMYLKKEKRKNSPHENILSSKTSKKNSSGDYFLKIRRTCSDISECIRSPSRSSISKDGMHPYTRQFSTPQPIKIRPCFRLPSYSSFVEKDCRMKRSQGTSHLRRSISQPIDIDKCFEAQISRMKNCSLEEGNSDNRLRRPSVGNLLDEEETSKADFNDHEIENWEKKIKLVLDQEDTFLVYAEALWDHVSLDSDELVFKAGDQISVIDSSDKDWWWGRISQRLGWFPSAFVRLLVNQDECKEKVDTTDQKYNWTNRRLFFHGLGYDQIRTNVINEILSTEKDFVKHLKDVVDGYLKQIRKRSDLFSEETVSAIFGNIAEIYSFQKKFLHQLDICIDRESPHRSCIGQCFIVNKSRFEIYSEYCNNQPSSVSAMQEIYQDPKLVHFLEACRLLQEMIDISLDGFLLTPVQKICKYPLQLQELLKYTKPSHPDYEGVSGALHAMKSVALLINERKRRMECLEKLVLWQMGVDNWQGPDILNDSTQLIHQGEVTKGIGSSWPKDVILFLFDHQLIYCKRDILKRNSFSYRGRVNLDLCEIVDIPNVKDSTKNVTVYHPFKIHCLGKSKSYVFSCKSSSDKENWTSAFRKEREIVSRDEDSGFVVGEKQKMAARIVARSHKPKRPRIIKAHRRGYEMTYDQAKLLVNKSFENNTRANSLPVSSAGPFSKKRGTWFNFSGYKRNKQ